MADLHGLSHPACLPYPAYRSFLAGGLKPSNVGEAVSMVQPFAIDVSSGVETDKVKDIAKITAFIGTAKMPIKLQ